LEDEQIICQDLRVLSSHFLLGTAIALAQPVVAREETGELENGSEPKEATMNPYVVSAQFAAYVWYEHQNPEKSKQDAALFARRNWVSFLPCAHKGVGKLLTKIAEPRMAGIRNGWSESRNSRETSPRKPGMLN
jgi:hypothetical protein